MTKTPSLYDEISYPARSFEYTHPNRLATMAMLYGMAPAPISNCRVLDLGCGSGGNIIPMAYRFPESEFVGIDLSAEAVATGNKQIAELGLTNVVLHKLDILDVEDQFGTFDYIISHGVYSWVPPAVREKILAILKRLMNPHGVSYLSFNAHPFSRLRDMVRDMMLFHTRHLKTSQEKIAQARSIMKFLTDASGEDSLHGKIMRYQNERIDKMIDELLFHDDLNPIAEAFLLDQVIEQAGRHKLNYLADVDFSRQDIGIYPEGVRKVLAAFPETAMLSRDQYQDFIDGTGFRRALLCHDHVELKRSLRPDFIKQFFLSVPKEPLSSLVNDPDGKMPAPGPNDLATLQSPLGQAAQTCLREAWPRLLTFDELLDAVLETLPADGRMSRSEADAELTELLADAARRGHVAFRVFRPDLVTSVSERPEVSAVARLQARESAILTTVLHSLIVVDNAMTREVIAKIDGTRTVSELQAETDRINSSSGSDTQSPNVNELLARLAGAGLLVA